MPGYIQAYVPMLVLGAAALAVFVSGALSPTSSRLFRGLALAGAGLACLCALGLQPGQPGALVDSGPYARFFTVLLSLLTFLSLLFAGEYARRRGFERDEFHALMLLAGLGMVLMAVAADWIMLAMGLETLSLPLYVLIASRREGSWPMEAGVKYFMLGAVASVMVFFGAALLYAVSGSVDISGSLTAAGKDGIALLGVGFVMAGLGFKLSLAPMHLWTPDVYQGAPAPVAAFLSGGAKVAVFAAVLRLALSGAPAWTAITPALWVLAALSMVGGTLGALTQPRVKRMLAYSSVAHVGFLLLALLAVPLAGAGPALFAAAAFGIMDVAAFGCLGLLSPLKEDADLIEVVSGLGLMRPWTGAALSTALLTLAGLPPTVGFISKLVIFRAALSAGYFWLSIIGVAMAIVGVFYVLRVLTALYGKKAPDEAVPPADPGFSGWVALVLSMILMIGLGVVPMPVLDAAARAVTILP